MIGDGIIALAGEYNDDKRLGYKPKLREYVRDYVYNELGPDLKRKAITGGLVSP